MGRAGRGEGRGVRVGGVREEGEFEARERTGCEGRGVRRWAGQGRGRKVERVGEGRGLRGGA